MLLITGRTLIKLPCLIALLLKVLASRMVNLFSDKTTIISSLTTGLANGLEPPKAIKVGSPPFSHNLYGTITSL